MSNIRWWVSARSTFGSCSLPKTRVSISVSSATFTRDGDNHNVPLQKTNAVAASVRSASAKRQAWLVTPQPVPSRIERSGPGARGAPWRPTPRNSPPAHEKRSASSGGSRSRFPSGPLCLSSCGCPHSAPCAARILEIQSVGRRYTDFSDTLHLFRIAPCSFHVALARSTG
ncbi:hypothetical protein EDE05_11773 [Neorhizobium sp. R1-B]|nr:hypothetical protein EDE05_11773 [Neorhizobium sp. R1-B]